jgi:hypothetical protein
MLIASKTREAFDISAILAKSPTTIKLIPFLLVLLTRYSSD